MRRTVLALCASLLTLPVAGLAAEPSDDKPKDAEASFQTIALQGLNKVTGRTSKLEGPVGVAMRFGTLEIVPRRCWKSAPEDRPENAALLEISELRSGEAPRHIFLGWMFSSSPGLIGLEHPVYDITVLSCDKTEKIEQ